MKCKDCPYFKDYLCNDALDFGYCPNVDYGEDFSSAFAREVQEQNDSYTIWKLKGNKD